MTFPNPPGAQAPRGRIIAALLAAVAISALGPPGAHAQWSPRPGEPDLTREDVSRLQAAVARLNEGRSIGDTERWRSLQSKDAGEVRVVRSFDFGGMDCRTVRYAVRFHSNPGAPLRFLHDWCHEPDGSWKIVEIPSVK